MPHDSDDDETEEEDKGSYNHRWELEEVFFLPMIYFPWDIDF